MAEPLSLPRRRRGAAAGAAAAAAGAAAPRGSCTVLYAGDIGKESAMIELRWSFLAQLRGLLRQVPMSLSSEQCRTRTRRGAARSTACAHLVGRPDENVMCRGCCARGAAHKLRLAHAACAGSLARPCLPWTCGRLHPCCQLCILQGPAAKRVMSVLNETRSSGSMGVIRCTGRRVKRQGISRQICRKGCTCACRVWFAPIVD